MPLTLTRVFRVRHYECDGFGRVHPANYLRYMQEAAFDATAAAGYDMARYDAMNRMWLTHETGIEYLSPLSYGDSVEVTTWVADFRKVRSIRAYELRRAADRELVARAHTDWAFLEKSTFRPVPIPDELIRAFYPEGSPEQAAMRERFPEPPPPPPSVLKARRHVEWRDVDPARHVNNGVYLAYAEESLRDMCRAYGWPSARLESTNRALAAHRHRVEYKQQAVMDDELEITAWAFDVSEESFTRHTIIHRVSDGALMAQVRSEWGWIDLESGEQSRAPTGLMADWSSNVVG